MIAAWLKLDDRLLGLNIDQGPGLGADVPEAIRDAGVGAVEG
jgi:hypothetical protein